MSWTVNLTFGKYFWMRKAWLTLRSSRLEKTSESPLRCKRRSRNGDASSSGNSWSDAVDQGKININNKDFPFQRAVLRWRDGGVGKKFQNRKFPGLESPRQSKTCILQAFYSLILSSDHSDDTRWYITKMIIDHQKEVFTRGNGKDGGFQMALWWQPGLVTTVNLYLNGLVWSCIRWKWLKSDVY